MSYKPNNLSVLAFANNFTLWHYITADENIKSDGYFDNAADMFRTNDLLIATTATGTQFYIVFSDKKHASISPFAEQKIAQPKYKRMDLDEIKINGTDYPSKNYNAGIEAVKLKFGDLYVEVK